jgi:hypothetical protein
VDKIKEVILVLVALVPLRIRNQELYKSQAIKEITTIKEVILVLVALVLIITKAEATTIKGVITMVELFKINQIVMDSIIQIIQETTNT